MGNNRQFIELERHLPHKIASKQRLSIFKEIYQDFNLEDAMNQADRCLDCGNPYCQVACPVHNYIPNWLQLVAKGDILSAIEISHKTNSLPEMCGRICPQDRLCEGACTLEDAKFGAVTIGQIEKFIFDKATEMGWQPDISKVPKLNKKVAVIGAGPAGLACADILVRNGINVEVFDKHPEIGGLLTFGIPQFKLDKQIVNKRRKIFENMGVKFHLNQTIEAANFSNIYNKFDAIFLGMGVYKPLTADIPGEDLQNVYLALDFLIGNVKHNLNIINVDNAEHPFISMKGKKVIVLGGGDTTMDCTRTSIRQGAKEVCCVYRRDEKNMPGSKTEVQNAKEEGVNFKFNMMPVEIFGDDGKVKMLKTVKTRMVNLEQDGDRQVAEVIPNSEQIIECDAIIVAFGFKPNPPAWLADYRVTLTNKKTIATNELKQFQTSNPKIFSGGDMVRGSSLVVHAVAEGRQGAQGILNYIQSLH